VAAETNDPPVQAMRLSTVGRTPLWLMLLYTLLHLTGYDLPLDELKRFRHWGSRTPRAIAERRLATEFNRPGHDIVDHWTYAICSDGDFQERIAAEVASLAGHLRLGKLVMLYDDNRVQLDGPTTMAFSEDVLARFRAYGWHTDRVEDGTDVAAIEQAIGQGRQDERPSIIAVRTVIGFYHGGLLPYAATFLTFSDYMRGSVRLAALSRLPVTYVWTDDSVGLGETGAAKRALLDNRDPPPLLGRSRGDIEARPVPMTMRSNRSISRSPASAATRC